MEWMYGSVPGGCIVRSGTMRFVYTFREFSIAQIVPDCNKAFVEFAVFLENGEIQAIL